MTASGFRAPTEIVTGQGAVSKLGAIISGLGARRAAVVCDAGVAHAGLLDRILQGQRLDAVEVCALAEPDPTFADVETAAQRAREARPDCVLAVGGGSGLVLGKAVALRLANPEPILSYAGADLAPEPPLPTVAVPTTGGSGSEVSSVIVLRAADQASAVVLQGRTYAPTVAVLDGELLASLPRAPLVAAALDALSHALEALWARRATAFTDALALEAARMIRDALPRALQADERSLQVLVEAGAMANLACGNSGLALVHALSLSTAVRLPHGYQNGVLLPVVAAFNRDAVPARVAAEIDFLAPLYEQIDFKPRFGPGEVDGAAAREMVDVALRTPLSANNVRPAGDADLRRILQEAGAAIEDVTVTAAEE